jgi:hypothetical protein
MMQRGHLNVKKKKCQQQAGYWITHRGTVNDSSYCYSNYSTSNCSSSKCVRRHIAVITFVGVYSYRQITGLLRLKLS